jgi:transcription antitermination factor NusG
METLKFMLYNAENPVHIESTCFQVGRSVRVARGKLQGLEGNVLQSPEGESYVVVGLDILGYARVQIDCADLEYIK